MIYQVLHRGIFEGVGIIQPQGVGKQRDGLPVVTIVGVPDVSCLGAQAFNAVSAQQIQNLLTGIAPGGFRQHGQREIHIGWGIGAIALARQELRNATAPEIIQTVVIAPGLVVLGCECCYKIERNRRFDDEYQPL